MKILLLTQWYPPEPVYYIAEMAETLQELGHEVTVLTGFPNWPSGKLYTGYKLRMWQRQELNGIQIIRVPLFPDHSRSAVRRALNFLSFAISATFLGFWLTPRPDVIHVHHPPITIGLPAIVLSLLWRVPFTLEIQDMWPENLRSTGMLSNGWILSLIGRFARWVYSKAASVRVISPGFRQNLIDKGLPDAKIRVISNWVDTDSYRPLSPDPVLAQEYGMAQRFNVLYAGTIGLAQGLDVLLDTARLLDEIPDLQFVLAGTGLELDSIRQTAAARGLTNIKFLGWVPIDATPQLYALADVLLVHLKDDPLFAITIPHKVFTYLAAGKPILAAMRGDVADLIHLTGAGLTCFPSDPQSLASAVRELHRLSPDERSALGQRGRMAACEAFGRTHLVTQLSQMLCASVARAEEVHV